MQHSQESWGGFRDEAGTRSKERSLEPPDAPTQFCVGGAFFVGLGGVNLVKNNWEPQYLGLKQFSPMIYILYLKTSI